jgi:hypothetical protein
MSSNVITDKFTKKLLQKQFDEIFFRWSTLKFHLQCGGVGDICTKNKVKIVEFYSSALGYIDNRIVDLNTLLLTLTHLEWDHEFVKGDCLRVFITSSYWYDIYFPEYLSEETQEDYYESLENDVLYNYAVMDSYMCDNKILTDRLSEMQEHYFTVYGEELLPTEF